MANLFKKLTGVAELESKLEQQSQVIADQFAALTEWQCIMKNVTEQQEQLKAELAAAEAAKAQVETDLATIKQSKEQTPKERATLAGQPWFDVVKTQVNHGDVKRGYFELDWNEKFIENLKADGYGFNGDTDESIVDRWFKELCATVVVEGDWDGNIDAGALDITTILKDIK